ncbi:MAG: chemotaxis protein CheW, partial [Pseudomonadales bacterium]|nr:chemotaxis protein CheW [Pseudomonadales bacterium]
MTEVTETNDRIPAFQVSLQKHNLLIPEATIAEIIPYEPLQRVQETPDWFLGILGWRGIQVPVISFEMLTMARASFSLASVSSASLVILRALGGHDDLSYFVLVAQSAPRRSEVGADELFEVDEAP